TNNLIKENIISFNNQGITIQGYSQFNVIKNNSINNCPGYGISIQDSYNNSIYLNSFENNYIQAIEYGFSNDWDNGTIGNYWDDYIE
ncbi:unnamed protein product, partial [marine sediment metagenome]